MTIISFVYGFGWLGWPGGSPSGAREAAGFSLFTYRGLHQGWVAQAGWPWLFRCLRFWLFPVAVEDSQRDYPNRSHRKLYELFHEVTVSEVTMSLATFRELLVYPHPHPSWKKRTDMVSFLFFFFQSCVLCVYVWGQVHHFYVCAQSQNKASDPLELEL